MFELRAPSLPIRGHRERFPVGRMFLIGRNYAEHVKEMGAVVDKGNPVFFMKPADALVSDGGDAPYPSATQNLHHEVELVLALGDGALNYGGRPQDAESAWHMVMAYGVGNDLTRRDLQLSCKAKGLPWDISKGFDHSAVVSELVLASAVGRLKSGAIKLSVNGQLRQRDDISAMVFSIPEILLELGKFFVLKPGDLVFTGTPAGVGPLHPGDYVEAEIASVGVLQHRITG